LFASYLHLVLPAILGRNHDPTVAIRKKETQHFFQERGEPALRTLPTLRVVVIIDHLNWLEKSAIKLRHLQVLSLDNLIASRAFLHKERLKMIWAVHLSNKSRAKDGIELTLPLWT